MSVTSLPIPYEFRAIARLRPMDPALLNAATWLLFDGRPRSSQLNYQERTGDEQTPAPSL
jgi:hypothetical protein